jgi:hypothetical protein
MVANRFVQVIAARAGQVTLPGIYAKVEGKWILVGF